MSNPTADQKLPDRETEVLLRDFADEWGTIADAKEQGGSITPRLTNVEVSLLRRAADELEQEKQTAEALAAELNKLRRIKSLIQRVCGAAADTIERLTAELAAERAASEQERHEEQRLLAALDEVLRLAGERIRGTTHYEGCADDHPWCRAFCIAQGALSRNARPAVETKAG